MEEILVNDEVGFSCSIFGWPIDNPPPDIMQPQEFQPSPTPFTNLEIAGSQILAQQTVTPLKPNSKAVVVENSSDCNNENEFWVVVGTYNVPSNCKNKVMKISLEMSIAADVSMDLCLSAVNDPDSHQPDTFYTITANGNVVVSGKSDVISNWHSVNIQIDGKYLKQGINEIEITAINWGVWIQSIAFSTVKKQVSANYYWQQIAAAYVLPGDDYNHSISYTQGNTSTDSETESFAETLGLSMGVGGIDSLLSGLSLQLSASFTATQSKTHSISIAESVTKTTGVQVSCPSGYKSNTFQVWQLCLMYQVDGQTLVQALGDSQAPLMFREFAEKE